LNIAASANVNLAPGAESPITKLIASPQQSRRKAVKKKPVIEPPAIGESISIDQPQIVAPKLNIEESVENNQASS
jgi:hypothetical protein